MPATYHVYILQNCQGKFYVGLSDNVARRIEQHNAGKSRWTKGPGPWSIVWQSGMLSLRREEIRTLAQKTKRRRWILSANWSAETLKAAPRHGGAAPATKSMSSIWKRLAAAYSVDELYARYPTKI